MVKTSCIDEKTGEIFLSGGLKIGPSLSKDELLSSALGDKTEPWGGHTPFYHFRIIAATCDGTPFVFVLSFREENLLEVALTYDSADFGSSWQDWSEARERSRKSKHDEWLRKIGIREKVFHWGEVNSTYDDQIGASSIVVMYSAHADRYSKVRQDMQK